MELNEGMGGQEKQVDEQDKPSGGTTWARNIVLAVGDGAEIHLRRPTTKELNKHDQMSHPRSKKGLQMAKADPEGARAWLFDQVFVKAVNCSDDDGPIPEDGKDRIPEDAKVHMVLHFVQSQENIELKNS